MPQKDSNGMKKGSSSGSSSRLSCEEVVKLKNTFEALEEGSNIDLESREDPTCSTTLVTDALECSNASSEAYKNENGTCDKNRLTVSSQITLMMNEKNAERAVARYTVPAKRGETNEAKHEPDEHRVEAASASLNRAPHVPECQQGQTLPSGPWGRLPTSQPVKQVQPSGLGSQGTQQPSECRGGESPWASSVGCAPEHVQGAQLPATEEQDWTRVHRGRQGENTERDDLTAKIGKIDKVLATKGRTCIWDDYLCKTLRPMSAAEVDAFCSCLDRFEDLNHVAKMENWLTTTLKNCKPQRFQQPDEPRAESAGASLNRAPNFPECQQGQTVPSGPWGRLPTSQQFKQVQLSSLGSQGTPQPSECRGDESSSASSVERDTEAPENVQGAQLPAPEEQDWTRVHRGRQGENTERDDLMAKMGKIDKIIAAQGCTCNWDVYLRHTLRTMSAGDVDVFCSFLRSMDLSKIFKMEHWLAKTLNHCEPWRFQQPDGHRAELPSVPLNPQPLTPEGHQVQPHCPRPQGTPPTLELRWADMLARAPSAERATQAPRRVQEGRSTAIVEQDRTSMSVHHGGHQGSTESDDLTARMDRINKIIAAQGRTCKWDDYLCNTLRPMSAAQVDVFCSFLRNENLHGKTDLERWLAKTIFCYRMESLQSKALRDEAPAGGLDGSPRALEGTQQPQPSPGVQTPPQILEHAPQMQTLGAREQDWLMNAERRWEQGVNAERRVLERRRERALDLVGDLCQAVLPDCGFAKASLATMPDDQFTAVSELLKTILTMNAQEWRTSIGAPHQAVTPPAGTSSRGSSQSGQGTPEDRERRIVELLREYGHEFKFQPHVAKLLGNLSEDAFTFACLSLMRTLDSRDYDEVDYEVLLEINHHRRSHEINAILYTSGQQLVDFDRPLSTKLCNLPAEMFSSLCTFIKDANFTVTKEWLTEILCAASSA